jgi:alpha-galactosidase
MTKIALFISIGILATLFAGVRLTARPDLSAQPSESAADELPYIQSASLRIEFDRNMRSRVVVRLKDGEVPLGAFSESETVSGREHSWRDFAIESQTHERVTDVFGGGEKLTVTGSSVSLRKILSVTIYDEFASLAAFDVSYTNTGKSQMQVLGWSNNGYGINARRSGERVAFWSFQSGSYERRPNWVLPLKTGFYQQNYLGMNASDYGGGTPIVDVWRKDVGVGVGLLEPGPRLISLPVSMPNARQVRVGVLYRHKRSLQPGESFHTFRTFVAVHSGDYFQTLVTYRRYMSKLGFRMASVPEDAFGAIWCAWGYGRNFKPQQVYDTLPTVKRMGFKWVTLDDGWQNNYGDWQLDPKKFPNGDADIKAMVDRIHQEGFKAQLWWSPLSAVPTSKLLVNEPDLVLKNQDGSRRKISWWDSYYLCPANPRVVSYHKELVRKILVDLGI